MLEAHLILVLQQLLLHSPLFYALIGIKCLVFLYSLLSLSVCLSACVSLAQVNCTGLNVGTRAVLTGLVGRVGRVLFGRTGIFGLVETTT